MNFVLNIADFQSASTLHHETNTFVLLWIIIRKMGKRVYMFSSYFKSELSFANVVLFYLGISRLPYVTHGEIYLRITSNMTNSTSLKCSVMDFRSLVETAVRCEQDMDCLAAWSSEEKSVDSNFALCKCMTNPAYGSLANGTGNLDLKIAQEFQIGKWQLRMILEFLRNSFLIISDS